MGKYHFLVINDHLWGPSVHMDKSFKRIQAGVRPWILGKNGTALPPLHGGKKGQQIRAGVPPTPLFGQCPRENIFFRELFPNMWWSILFKLKLYIVGSSAHLTFMTTSIAISETWWVILQSEGCQFPKADDYVRRGGGDPTRKGWDGKQQLRKHCQWHLGNISDSGNNNNNVYGLCLSS